MSAGSPDALVIGAGIVGAACAHYLAQDGASVTILESRFPGAGTTGAGMGHLVVMDDSPAQLSLTAYALRLWRDLAGGLSAAAEYQPCGTVWVAEDGEQLAAAARRRDLYERHGIAAQTLSAADLARLEPSLRAGLAGGLLVPGDGVLYQPVAARELIRLSGARLRTGARVREVSADGVLLEGGERLSAGAVVNAAGPWAPRLARGLPVTPRKGHLVITDRAPGFLHHQVVELGYLASAHATEGDSVAFNLQPRATGQVLVGSSREYAGWDGSINRAIVARMLSRAVAFAPALARLTALRAWAGFRPATADRLPLIGRWRDGTWIAAGHEGLGITLAPATGRLVADLISGRAPEVDPAPFSPARTLRPAAAGEAP